MAKFDCRSIKDSKCKYLNPAGYIKFGKIPYIYFCGKMHITLFPEIYNKHRMNEKLITISPDFNCPYMQQLRKRGYCSSIEFSINPDRSSNYWN